MSTAVSAIESFVGAIPLPWLELWGFVAYSIGLALAVLAFGGFTFRAGDRWALGRQRQSWDARAVLSIPVTFVLTTVAGYLGSFVVLVPGAQTFESVKDLVVFLCVVLFGYPALITVPFAYGLSDLIEGVPPDLLLAWLPGYFMNPACFWLAYQLIGRQPDFRQARTWTLYGLFVLIFTAIEPASWGYITSGAFTSAISYRSITSALLFTTAITWALAPFAMLAALPAARRLGLFWADIPGHVEERTWRPSAPSGVPSTALGTATRRGWPIRMVIVTPFLVVVMLLVGATAFVTLRSARADAQLLASRLHRASAENIRLLLDSYLAGPGSLASENSSISRLLAGTPASADGLAMVLDRAGSPVASSAPESDAVATLARSRVRDLIENGEPMEAGATFELDVITERPLSRTTWLGHATTYANGVEGDWIVVTLMPESYYLAGVHAGSRRSALVFAVALMLALAVGTGLASRVTEGLRQLAGATRSLAGGDLGVRVPESRVLELDALARSFNDMADRLKGSIDDLNERETFLRMTQDAAEVGSWEFDLVADRMRWSDQLARMHGIEAADFDGNPETAFAFCHPEDLPRLREVIQRMRAGADSGPFECRVRPRGGGVRDLWFRGQVTRDGRGSAVRVLGIAVDITDRKRMENLLAAETRALGLIAGEVPLREVLTVVAKGFEELRPGTLASILLLDADGVHVRHGAAPSLPAGYWEAIEGAPIGPKAGSCGTAAYRRQAVIVADIDTDPLWADYRDLALAHGLRACWSTPILDPYGTVLGTFAMYYREPQSPSDEDLRLIARATRLAGVAIERERARDALRANEDRLLQEKQFIDKLMDSLPGVVILYDADGRLAKWNQVLERVSGYAPADLAAMSAIDLVSPEDTEAVARAPRRGVEVGPHAGEARVLNRWGQAIPYYFTGARLVTEKGPHALGIGIDISDRRRLEEQFRQAQKMEAVGHLAAGIAHDFNNLLTIISSSAQFLAMDSSITESDRELIDAIRDAGNRAASLTRQLLSFSRKTVLQPRALDLNVEICETEKMLRRVIGEEVRLVTSLEPNLHAMKVDPGQLGQVLVNLAVNARDAMPRGGTLTICTKNADIGGEYCRIHADATPGRHVLLSITDTGTGMPPEVRSHIFDPFFTTKEVGKGTGLGLAMVYGVVRQSGGHIDVQSEVGHGTTFDVYFPAVDEAPTARESAGSDGDEGGSETILLVEDDPGVRALSLRALRSRGYSVLVAVDGHDALRVSDGYAGSIDLVVTDVVMAGLSGRETVDCLCERRGPLRVLYVSGYTDDAIVRHGILHHEVEFLPKPFTPADLGRKVRETLGMRAPANST